MGAFLAVLAAASIAGCGGAGHKAASTAASQAGAAGPPPAPPNSAIAPNAPAVRALTARLLKGGDIPGLTTAAGLSAAVKPQGWVIVNAYPQSQRAAEVSRLQRLGFVSGVSEHLMPSGGNPPPEGLSVVVRFGSPGSATANLLQEVASSSSQGAKPFAVAGIPGARGFGGNFGQSTGYNVVFTSGPYYYLAGVGYPTATPGAPTKAQLVTAAQHLYARSHP